MDVAKLTALLIGSNEDIHQAWGVANAKGPRLPLALYPTTSGTGSEVTPISIITQDDLEKKLYLTRRRIENKIKALNINDFYICSLSTETIVNTNSDATLWLTGATADLTNIATSVKLRLKNFDGKTITLKDGQDFYLDTEIAQTSSTSTPTFDHQTDATSSTTNALTIKTFDSDTSNGDKSTNIAGLNFVDVKTINLNLLNMV